MGKRSGFIQYKPVISVVVLLCLSLISATPSYSGDTAGDRWQYHLIPYLWFTGVEGDVTVRGLNAHIDASFSDLFENLDMAAMALFEARRDRWGLFLNPFLSKLSYDSSVRSVSALVKLNFWILEFGGTCLVSGGHKPQSSRIDFLGGGRYWDQKVTIDVSVERPGVAFDVEDRKEWVDPFLGLRFIHPLAQKWLVLVRGDVGGFGISDVTSEFSWNIEGEIAYTPSRKISLWLGYRVLDVRYKEGEGNTLFELDTTFHGPVAGIGFRF